MLPLTSPVSDLIVGGISGLASLFGADSQSKNVQKTNEMNYRIAKEQNDLQAQLARENNDLQVQMMRENNSFNKQSAIDMFNLENEYNLPVNQIARLKAAGLNPATFYGSGATMGQSDASTPSASSSGISPSMPSFNLPTMQTPPAVLNTMFGNIESLSRSLGNVVKSGLDLASKKRTLTLLQAELDKMLADKDNVQANTAFQNVQKGLAELELAVGKQTKLKKELAEIKKIHKEAALAAYKGETEKAQKLFVEAETKLTNQKYQFNELYNPELLKNIQEERNLIIKKQETQNAMTESYYASAEASRAGAAMTREQTQRLIDTHEDFVEMSHMARSQQRIDYTKAAATMQDYIEQMHNANLLSNQQYEKVKSEIQLLEKEKNWYNFNQVLGTIERINNGVNKWAPWALSRDDMTPENGMMMQSWQSNSTY